MSAKKLLRQTAVEFEEGKELLALKEACRARERQDDPKKSAERAAKTIEGTLARSLSTANAA